jgi:predicted TIM-barrel fold metal-dependent hydrolase
MNAASEYSRRRFWEGAAVAGVALAALALGSVSSANGAEPGKPGAVRPLPGSAPASGAVKKGPVIDCHAHLNLRTVAGEHPSDGQLIHPADKMGIDQLCCSILCKRPATVEGFRQCNLALAEAVRRLAGRVLGYCYVNPAYQRESLDEIRRYVRDQGFIGVKLYNEYVCNEPVVFPIVELAIELGGPILQHAGHSHYFVAQQPRISHGGHLAELGRRYPVARLICAHVGGGGDWEWTIKALRHAPNVYLDTSGSVIGEGIVEMAAQTLSVDRLLFGCDMDQIRWKTAARLLGGK